jgi:Na+/proline symporter
MVSAKLMIRINYWSIANILVEAVLASVVVISTIGWIKLMGLGIASLFLYIWMGLMWGERDRGWSPSLTIMLSLLTLSGS